MRFFVHRLIANCSIYSLLRFRNFAGYITKIHLMDFRIGYSVSWEKLRDYVTRTRSRRLTQIIQPILIVYTGYTQKSMVRLF